ncbi:MAG: hypothetical protein AAFR28_17685 [Pseudomonadota bacterium]
MAEHWTDAKKHEAKEAFDEARRNRPRAHAPSPKGRDADPPQTPQPTLTPSGPLRSIVDERIREKRAAIKAKIARDREKERGRER